MRYHTDHICESCLDTANRLHELDRTRASIYSRKRYWARNFRITREERWAKLDMFENTLHDLTATAQMIRREHAEHVAA